MMHDGMAGGMDWMMGGMGVLSLLILILVVPFLPSGSSGASADMEGTHETKARVSLVKRSGWEHAPSLSRAEGRGRLAGRGCAYPRRLQRRDSAGR